MARSLDTQLLLTFVTVADVGSFTRAARLLGLTQSAASLQVRRLEDRVGSALLLRTNRRVTLTAAGEAFIDHAREILALQDRAFESVRPRPEGRGVRLGMPDVDALRYLPTVLEELAERHPGVQPEIICDVSPSLVEAFERGDLDLCLYVAHEREAAGTVVGDDPIAWVAHPNLALASDAPVPLALYPDYCAFRSRGLRALADAGRAYSIAYVSQSTAAIDIAIDRGWAVAIKSRRIVRPPWRELFPDEGFPALEPARIELRQSPARDSPVLRDLAELLVGAVQADLH